MKETRKFYEALGGLVMDNFREFDVEQTRRNRVNFCQAWFTPATIAGRNIVLVRSYNTIVAFYDEQTDCLVSLGRYSMTTYQHVRKFRNNYLPNGYKTDEINIELVNWF